VLVVDSLTVVLGKAEVLKGIDLVAPRGVTAVLGINGVGKTTLFRALAGLYPFGGSVSWKELGIEPPTPVTGVGFAPQEVPTTRVMTCHGLLTYLAVLDGKPRDEAMVVADACLTYVGLAEERNKRSHALSGGMKKRLGIAQALLSEHPVVLLDEPTSGLDLLQRRSILDLIQDLGRERTVLMSTHMASDVIESADRYVVLTNGSILTSGSTDSLDVAALERLITDAAQRGAA